MAANIEIEAKVLISEKDYYNIVERFEDKIIKEYEQVNYYIDTNDFKLKKLGIGLRIRYCFNIYTMTIKCPLSEGLLEKDQIITKEAYLNFKNNNVFPEGSLKEFISMLGINIEELLILAHLRTLRKECDDGNPETTFSIDKNTYNKIVDYELELEGNNLTKVKELLKQICIDNDIEYKDNLVSKQSRAMSTIKK